MTLLVTGAAGFIGFHTARELLARGESVVGLDNLNDYYDPSLKAARLKMLEAHAKFRFVKADLSDRESIEDVFKSERFTRVIHLAAQAGVRYSIDHPHVYIDSNVTGYLHILEGCRRHAVEHLVYASTSSVYGANSKMPFKESEHADHPLTLYAATKRANELMAHSYSNLYGLPTTGLRFFTVYGPWGRPDMALFLFTKNILAGLPIDVFNHGHHRRDFTYIDDIVAGILAATSHTALPDGAWDAAHPDPSRSRAPFRVYNIGNERPIQLLDYISLIEKRLKKPAIKNLLPIQLGDVPDNCADVTALATEVGYKPSTSVDIGVERFLDWYLEYYRPGSSHSG